MTTLLAIDTSTDACSLALQQGDEVRQQHVVIPRRHQQELFALLSALLDGQSPRQLGVRAILFGFGPGSFTGLRIAASFAQGLAYSLGVPVLSFSSLEIQARTYLRQHRPEAPALLLSSIDARIGQVYAAAFFWDGEALVAADEARVSAPQALTFPDAYRSLPIIGLGSGFRLRDQMPPWQGELLDCAAAIVPEAMDMLAIGTQRLAAGEGATAASALPDYVQQHSGWKTLAEQEAAR